MDISDDELEPFQMTGDEFQPRRRKFTKEDMIYGMWAEHDSDEEQSRYNSNTTNELGIGWVGGELWAEECLECPQDYIYCRFRAKKNVNHPP